MFKFFNPNPVHLKGRVGDCAVRAISKALDISWEQAFAKLSMNAFLMGDMPSSDLVIGSVLRQAGFKRESISDNCDDCYTVEEFCEENPEGTFVIKSDGHVATVVDGDLYDVFDSSGNTPIYVWTNRKDD